jgi:hypothetical protein
MEYNPLPPMIPSVAIADGFARVLFLSDFFDVAISPLPYRLAPNVGQKAHLNSQAGSCRGTYDTTEVVPDTAATFSLA